MFTLSQSFALARSRLFSITGRSSRAEYWWCCLCFILLYVALTAIKVLAILTIGTIGIFISLACVCIELFTSVLLSLIAVRRLHDLNLSGWWYLLFILCYVALHLAAFTGHYQLIISVAIFALIFYIAIIVLLAWPGTKGANRFGINPIEDLEGHYNYYTNGMHKKMGAYGTFQPYIHM